MERSPVLLRLRSIAKQYPGVTALSGVGLELARGEIHAVLGENGAGKSTLMKIIYGAVQPDAGEIEWQGQPVRIPDPVAARALGIAMVFQHFALFESISVVENIALALPGPYRLRALAERIGGVAERYGLPLDPWRPVHELSMGERQRVEIVRCLLQSPRLLIMDEPTSVLTPQAIDQLFETLRALAREGTSILYVSHKLEEIRRLCDSATILRGGKLVADVDPKHETEDSLAAAMIGRAFPKTQKRARAAGDEALVVSLPSVDLRVRSGEVFGIAGISGNGQAELLAAISGERLLSSPAVSLNGKNIGHFDAAARRALGLAYVPEERLGRGAVPEMSLAENTLLTAYRGKVRSGMVDRALAAQHARETVAAFDVRCAGVEARASSLSGGNLQKFIVGREMSLQPKVMVLAQPTWGVDIAATALIRQRILDLAARGVAVLIVSEDLGEILEICDRVAVMAGSRLSPPREVGATDAMEIGRWMAGGFPIDATVPH
jgi:simple sugar transport system ATP-binding protein